MRRCSPRSAPFSDISSRSGSAFRGGKGVATFIGVTLALDWRVGLLVTRHLARRCRNLAHLFAVGAGRRRAGAALSGPAAPCALCLLELLLVADDLRHASREHSSPCSPGEEPRIGAESGGFLARMTAAQRQRTPRPAPACAHAEYRTGDVCRAHRPLRPRDSGTRRKSRIWRAAAAAETPRAWPASADIAREIDVLAKHRRQAAVLRRGRISARTVPRWTAPPPLISDPRPR